MKKNLLIPVVVSMSAVCALPMSAEIVGYTTEEGIVYNVDKSEQTAVLARVELTTGIKDLVVPDEISYENETYKVVGIADGACINNALLSSVKIGANVTTVGVQSFYGCSSLTEATLPASLKMIKDQAFYNCKKLASPVLPEGLEEIGSYAFWSNNAATEVNLPSTLVTIGGNPWGCCAALSSFTIDAEAANFSVSDDVLFDKDLTILISYPVGRMVTEYATPATTRIIKDNSMRNNPFLSSVTLNEGLEVIGTGAFNVCRFTTIAIPASVKEIGARAFTSNPSLIEFDVAEGNENYAVFNKFLCTKDGKRLLQGLNIEEVVIPESVEDIEEYAFYKMSNIKSVKLTNTKTIGQSAFYQDSQISSVDFGSSLESIGNMAFMYCSMKEVVLPATMKSIGNKQAFLGCMALEKLVLNEGIEELGDAAFMQCVSLKEVYVPGTVTKFGNGVFSHCSGLESIEFGEGLKVVGPSVVYYGSSVKTVKIADSVTEIGTFAFSDCTAIEEINIPTELVTIGNAAFQSVPITGDLVIPANVTSIGSNAFTSTKITSLETNAALKSIGDWAFAGSYHMESVRLNDGLESIGAGAFAACELLTNFEIPSTVETIGDGFLANCMALSEIIDNSTAPQVLEADPVSVEVYDTCVLKVPAGYENAYGNAAFWMNFSTIEGFGSGVADEMTTDSAEITDIYDLNGVRVENPSNGIYVVRYSDGSVRKITR